MNTLIEGVCRSCKNWEAINKSNNAGVCAKKCKKKPFLQKTFLPLTPIHIGTTLAQNTLAKTKRTNMNTLPDMQEWINRRRLSASFYAKVLNYKEGTK